MHRHTHLPHRDHSIIVGVVLLAAVGLPVFFLAEGGFLPSPIVINDVHPAAMAVPFIELTAGTQSVVAKRVNYVLTSPDELKELWEIIDAPGTPPWINFNTHMVLAVFAGNESSTSIAIAKIEDSHTRLVSVALTKPEGSCEEVSRGGTPYEIVAVPSTSLPLAHEDLAISTSCPK